MRSPLEQSIFELTGIDVAVEAEVPGRRFFVRVNGLNRPHGFRIEVTRRFSYMDATFELDNLASHFRNHLEGALHHRNAEFIAIVRNFESLGIKYRNLPSFSEETIEWKRFESRVDSGELNTPWNADKTAVLSILLPVLQLLEAQHVQSDETVDFVGDFEIEGDPYYRKVRGFERSRLNRALAIEIHGRTCAVCGIDFDAFYGRMANGYIEIHHLTPVSMMEAPAIVDPRTDLVPLCANCHRVAHRRWPPYTPAEMLDGIRGRQRRSSLPDT